MKKGLYRIMRVIGRKLITKGSNSSSEMKRNGELWLQRILAGSCTVVIDVGANHGSWTSSLIEINNGLRVICVEAVPQFASAIADTLGNKVEVLNLALSDTKGHVSVYKAGGGGAGSSWVQKNR